MLWRNERAVMVGLESGDTIEILGSGTDIGHSRILTARHVVTDDDGNPLRDLVVTWGGRHSSPAAILWSSDAQNLEVDVAVLTVDGSPVDDVSPMMLLSGRSVEKGEIWEAMGYPMVDATSTNQRLEKVGGVSSSFDPTNPAETQIDLSAAVNPDTWGGLSGAAIVFGDRVLGVACAIPSGWDGKRLLATPVSRFIDDPDFRIAVGLVEVEAGLESDVDALQQSVQAFLEAEPLYLAHALARRFGVPRAQGDENWTLAVARRMTRDVAALDLVAALNELDYALARTGRAPGARDRAAELLFRLLPLAWDLRPIVAKVRSGADRGEMSFELPLHHETMAEVVLAGVHRQCCRFRPLAPGEQRPVGFTTLTWPVVLRAPMLDLDGAQVVEAVVQYLAAKELFGLDHVPRGERASHVETELANRRRFPGDEALHYFLVLHDADLNGPPDPRRAVEPIGDRWEVVRTALGAALPSLEVVRLVGGLGPRETAITSHLTKFISRKR